MSAEAFRAELLVPGDRIITAYDGMDWSAIVDTAREVGPFTGHGKTNSAQVRPGADFAVNALADAGQLAMLDFKFHDIPRTVEFSVREATMAGGSLITVHASGGQAMLEAAVKGAEAGREAITDPFKKRSLPVIGGVLGITVLTSLNGQDCESIFGIPTDDEEGIQKKVIQFAHMALDAGLTGIVCSPLEARAVRNNSNFDSLLVVTPGITPKFAIKEGDQSRSTTAKQAIGEGADLVVVGSAINKAADYGMTKAEASQAIGEEVKEGLALAA